MKWFGRKQKEVDQASADLTVKDESKEEAQAEDTSWFGRLTAGLGRTSQSLMSGLESALGVRATINDDVIEALETELLMADVGVATTQVIMDRLIATYPRNSSVDAEAVMTTLKRLLEETLVAQDVAVNEPKQGPFVILVVGVNGAGKTTTIGKLAHRYQSEGKSVMLAAGDTFRAAAVEQLQTWGERNNVPVIAQHTGADSASVLFDALNAAQARNIDVLLADTAGRLNNKAHLMTELEKIGVRALSLSRPPTLAQVIVMPNGPPSIKVDAVRKLGGTVRLHARRARVRACVRDPKPRPTRGSGAAARLEL